MAEDGFAAFVAVSGTRLLRAAYLLTGDRGRAEDLTQDTLSRVYSAWPRVRHEDAYAYARRVLVNLNTDWWRRRRGRERPVARIPDRPDPTHPNDQAEQRDLLVRALQRLTRRERAMVVLRYFLDLSPQDTARELGCSIGTVKSTCARALAKLRAVPEPAGADRPAAKGHP